MGYEGWEERLVQRQKWKFIIKSGIGNRRGFSIAFLISTSITQKPGRVWEPNEKCIQQVLAHGENTQPHPNRVADVTTKLLFVCYTNHYTRSKAKAPLAVVAVRTKPHRTKVTELATRKNSIRRLGSFPWWFEPLQLREQRDSLGQFLPSYLPRTRQSTRCWSLGTPCPARRVIAGCWGDHTSYLAFWSAGKENHIAN